MFLSDILIISNVDWNSLWYQNQQFACNFASLGHRVYYFNRTLQRLPAVRHFKERFFLKEKYVIKNKIKKNIHVITPYLLTPFRIFRPINRLLIKKVLSSLNIYSPLLISYVPTYNTLDIINIINPSKIVYVNVHNFDSDKVIKDLLIAERELIKKSDVLFADSHYNMKRLIQLSNKREVFRSLPGVSYKLFSNAFRGDEVIRRKTIYYYGGIGPHLDFSLYNALAEEFKVIFIGVVDSIIRDKISSNIEIRPPVENSKLPKILWDSDILAIFYKDSSYIHGVIPAKFFECLATGKPVLVSGLEEVKPYLDIVYDVEGSVNKALNIIRKLPESETINRRIKRNKIAREADWLKRFKAFIEQIES